MGLMSGLAGIFDPDGAAAVSSAQYGVNQNMASDRYNNAGSLGISTPGSAANNALTQAIQAGATPVVAHTGAMTQDAGQLSGLSDLYYNLFKNGGPAEAAQTQQAAADIAGTAQRDIRAQSRAQAQSAMDVANAERGGNAAQSTQAGQNALLTKLQEFVYQAAASHATHQNALQAGNIQNALLNQQVSLDQQLRDHSTAAQNQNFQTGLQNQQQVNQVGNLALGAALSAGATSAGTAISALGQAAPAQTYTTDASGNVGGIVAHLPTPTSAYGSAGYATGYQTPVARAMTTTPYSATNTVYPTSASAPGDWLSGSVGLV